jgi:hypothetical protein
MVFRQTLSIEITANQLSVQASDRELINGRSHLIRLADNINLLALSEFGNHDRKGIRSALGKSDCIDIKRSTT